jgi:hypothetical protein
MKKIVSAIVVPVMLLSMSACSGNDDTAAPKDTVTVTATPTPDVSPMLPDGQDTPDVPDSPEGGGQVLSDADFAEYVRGHDDWFQGIPDDSIVTLANSVCTAFDSGQDFDSVFKILLENGMPQKPAASFIGWSVGNYCYEHKDIFSPGGTPA